ncbi:MAG: hypothetical protein OIF57_15730 [Marinobacterium sp.]|nr:hypothetical protein [Marinobacterium sp.]
MSENDRKFVDTNFTWHSLSFFPQPLFPSGIFTPVNDARCNVTNGRDKVMNFITKPVGQIIGVFWAVGITLGALYVLWPQGYAMTAHYVEILPMTDKAKEAAPDIWLAHKEAMLKRADSQLKKTRDRLASNRKLTDRKIAEYRKQERRSKAMLAQARSIYNRDPAAKRFYFIGKDYSASSFSTQLQVIQSEMEAARESLRSLEHAKEQVNNAWATVAKKDAQLSADIARLSTARILLESQNLLGDLDITTDFDDLNAISEHDIRTIEELILDADKLPVRPVVPADVGDTGLSEEAMRILLQPE